MNPIKTLPSISHLGCDREHKFGSCKSRHRGGDRDNAALVFAIGGSAMKLALVEKSHGVAAISVPDVSG